METTRPAIVAAALLAAACGAEGQTEPLDGPTGEVQLASHGPAPNLLGRLVNGPGSAWVLCDGRARGFTPGLTSSYSATLIIAYPSGATASRSGKVSLATPSHEDTTDGDFVVVLVETPSGSGEYSVMASFKRKTMERTAGDHQCRGQVEVDADGDGVNEGNALRGAAVVAHMPTGNAAERQSTTIRRIGNHVICQSRLNYANFAASPFYLVDFSADTDGGSEVIIDIPIGPLLPVYGPVPFAGGTLIMELGTPPGALPAPSVDVRFDFAGQASGSPASCATLITTLTGLGPVLDDSTTITIGSGI